MSKIVEIRSLLENKSINCRELTLSYLEGIKNNNDQLNAFISITPEAALKAADAVDRKVSEGKPLGPLEGIPMALKDNISTEGLETTCASRMLSGYKPIYDASVWQLLKGQNAPLLGKCNMDEFAMGSTCETSCIGGAKNPHNFSYVSGGSSGGSAAAVAANLAIYSLGSDTGGSIRQPASFCGLVGLKPTYGAVSRFGLIAYASSLDQIGPITTCAEDAAIVFDKISGHDTRDMTSCAISTSQKARLHLERSLKGLKIGIADEFFTDVESDVSTAVNEAIALFKKLGAETVPVSFPLLKYSLPVYYILSCAEASSNLGRYDGIRFGPIEESYDDINDMISKTRSKYFGREARRRILLGTYVLSSSCFESYYKKAQLLRRTILYRVREDIFSRCDILLTPTVPVTALKCGTEMPPMESYRTEIFTVMANITGLPAVSVPCGFDRNNLPIGMQLMGKAFHESEILNAAYMFEKESEGAFLSKLEMGCIL